MIFYKQYKDLSENYIIKKVNQFLLEDIPNGDKTSIAIVPKNKNIIAEIQAVEDLVFSGEKVIKTIWNVF